MAVKGYFYNANSLTDTERTYNGEDMNQDKAPFYKEGVAFGQLAVTAVDGEMAVNVDGGPRTGYAYINLHTIHNSTVLPLQISQSGGTLPRIDRIIIRNDEIEKRASILVLEGSYSSEPQPPELTNNDYIQEKSLAQIYVAAGAVEITQADITDERADTEVCGYIASQFEDVDFSQFAAQFKAFQKQQAEEWQSWFNDIKDKLTEDAAGELYTMISEIPIIEVSNSTTITEEGTALDATQANPDIKDSLAYKIKTTNNNIVAEWVSNQEYTKGEYCIHDGKLYQLTANSSQTVWFSPESWQEICIIDLISNAATNTATLNNRTYKKIVSSGLNTTADPNTTTEAVIRTQHDNCPTTNMFYRVYTSFTDDTLEKCEKVQIAIALPTNDKIYIRSTPYGQTTWSAWKELITNNVTDYSAKVNATSISYAKLYKMGRMASLSICIEGLPTTKGVTKHIALLPEECWPLHAAYDIAVTEMGDHYRIDFFDGSLEVTALNDTTNISAPIQWSITYFTET